MRDGYLPQRDLQIKTGPVAVQMPRGRHRDPWEAGGPQGKHFLYLWIDGIYRPVDCDDCYGRAQEKAAVRQFAASALGDNRRLWNHATIKSPTKANRRGFPADPFWASPCRA